MLNGPFLLGLPASGPVSPARLASSTPSPRIAPANVCTLVANMAGTHGGNGRGRQVGQGGAAVKTAAPGLTGEAGRSDRQRPRLAPRPRNQLVALVLLEPVRLRVPRQLLAGHQRDHAEVA